MTEAIYDFAVWVGPSIRLEGRDWALAHTSKPAWMNPKFVYGPPVREFVFTPPPPKMTKCPECGHIFAFKEEHRGRS